MIPFSLGVTMIDERACALPLQVCMHCVSPYHTQGCNTSGCDPHHHRHVPTTWCSADGSDFGHGRSVHQVSFGVITLDELSRRRSSHVAC